MKAQKIYLSSVEIARLQSLKADCVQNIRVGWIQRARAWLGRKRERPSNLRAKKQHRVKSLHSIKSWDNQCRKGLGWKTGLARFHVPEDKKKRHPDPLKWEYGSKCSDGAPDYDSATNFLQRHKPVALNFDDIRDINHLGWNATKKAMKRANVWAHQLNFLLAMIMRKGPWKTATRLQQCRESWNEYLTVATPETCPVFNDLLPAYLNEKGRSSEVVRPDVRREVWQEFLESIAWDEEGAATTLVRWWQFIESGRLFMPFWTETFIGQLYACVECDLLHGKSFDALLRESIKQSRESEGAEPTLMKDGSKEERTLTK